MVEASSTVQKRQGKSVEHKSRYLAMIQGPLLFTAPHSGKVKRGGEEYGEKRRTHLREKYTAVLALRLAHQMSTLTSQ